MSDTPIDMHLPESFHRLKRTTVLLCATLVVLSIASPEPMSELTLLLVGGVSLETWKAKVGLWVASAYYYYGFVLEVQSAHRINSKILRSEGVKEFEARMAEISETIARNAETSSARVVDGLSDHALRFLDEAKAAVRKQIEALEVKKDPREYLSLVGSITPVQLSQVPESQREAVLKHATVAIAEAQIRARGKLTSTLDTHLGDNSNMASVARQQGEILETQRSLAETMLTLAADLKTLHHQITGARRASFWRWEFGGATAAMVLATIVPLGVVLGTEDGRTAALTFLGWFVFASRA